MADGARTHDNWNHNPGLYQLSYSHQKLACPTGFAPVTLCLEGRCSIQLSYGQLTYQIKLNRAYFTCLYGRGGEIRTPDILLPKQARYQATLHPERANIAQIACLVKYIILHTFLFISFTYRRIKYFFRKKTL